MRRVNPSMNGEGIGGSCVSFMGGLPPTPDADTQVRLTLTKPYPNKDLRRTKTRRKEHG